MILFNYVNSTYCLQNMILLKRLLFKNCNADVATKGDFMFKNVIVRRPSKSMTEGITSSPELGKPDYENAIKQHESYVEALKKCGVKVTILEELEEFPDSCFVEDAALLTEKCAIITRPGALSRRKETERIVDTIEKFYDMENIEYIVEPGTLEGGDVMMVGDTFYVGLSERTNEEGIDQLTLILQKYEYKCITVSLEEVLHLKTGLAYLENNNLLVAGEFIEKNIFKGFTKIVVPEGEKYAANCIWVNDKVLVPEGYKEVKRLVEKAGYEVIIVDTSEYRKLDGGLSCLSLRF